MTDFVNSSLEDNRAAVIITSMDFSKAFNRLSHVTCLEEMKKKGASTEVMKLVGSFLTGRKSNICTQTG